MKHQPKTPSRNPAWTRDELILALNLYLECNGAFPAKRDARVQELSDLLNKFWRLQGYSGATLRNTNGVAMKLMNFRVHDPKYAELKGLKAGNKLEKEVWEEFANQPDDLKKTAQAICDIIQNPQEAEEALAPEQEIEAEAVEGQLLTHLHVRRERSKKLIAQKKKAVLENAGQLVCEACGFDFQKRYGERGAGFIECHHTKPLSDLPEERTTRLSDLALLCANCHRMIHAKRPWLSIPDLRDMIKKASQPH